MNPPKLLRRASRGFTLIELLVVLVILGLLATLVGPRVMKNVGESKTKTAKIQIEQFGQALEAYYLDVGKYPNSQEGLNALDQKPGSADAKWKGPYLKKSPVPKDPWGNDYQYAAPGKEGRPFDIMSFGEDGREGGDGEAQDVLSWK